MSDKNYGTGTLFTGARGKKIEQPPCAAQRVSPPLETWHCVSLEPLNLIELVKLLVNNPVSSCLIDVVGCVVV